jgi:hypothetical protein
MLRPRHREGPMKKPSRFQVGQRWEYKSPIPGFENTLVIGGIYEEDRRNHYEVYVRYSSVAKP